ncbi:putative serine/threonine specific phosphatase domain protein [Synechococcus sp. MEDNS5]|nr:putative serine/threonine specific phosphatase domain protein [Synechococcus sp. MEDNS5]
MIDTGAVYGGLLTAFCPETDAVVQVHGPRAISESPSHQRELATGLPC